MVVHAVFFVIFCLFCFLCCCFFFFQAEDGIRDVAVTGIQTCALPIFDWVHARLLKTFDSLHEEEWERCGMYAPTQWDPVSFKDYMTLEDIFRMPLLHFTDRKSVV